MAINNWDMLTSDDDAPTVNDWDSLIGDTATAVAEPPIDDRNALASSSPAGLSANPATESVPTVNRFAKLQELHQRIKAGDESARPEREAERSRLQAEYESENRNFITKSLPFRTAETAAKGIKAGNEMIVAEAGALAAGAFGKEQIRDSLRGVSKRVAEQQQSEAFIQGELDKEGLAGQTLTGWTRQAGAAISEAMLAGGGRQGLKNLAVWYGSKSAAESHALGKSFSESALHGVIETAATLAGGKLLGAGTAQLAGTGKKLTGTAADKVAAFLANKASGKIGKALSKIAGASSAEIVEEVGTEAAHYLTSVGFGEQFDVKEFTSRLVNAAGPAAISGGGAKAVQSAINSFGKDVAKLQADMQTAADNPKIVKAAEKAIADPPPMVEFLKSEAGSKPILTVPIESTAGAVKTWMKENLTSAGLRNEAIDSANDARLGNVAANLRKMAQLRSDLDRAVNAEFGGRSKLTPDQVRKIDDALKGKQTDLPDTVLAAINPMRAHVDGLSRQLLDSGVVDPDTELGITIDQNVGTYITRTYRKHSEPNWMRHAVKDRGLMDRARQWLQTEYPNDTPDVTDWRILAMLDKDSAAAKAPAGVGKSDRDFMSVLRERKDLPDLVRELYGEYRDPWINYSTSIAKMANLAAHKEFMRTVQEVGLSTGFLSTPDAPNPQNYRRIDGTKNPRLAELDGLYADPQTAKALADLFSPEMHAGIYRAATRLAGYAKWAQTVGNTKTHVRNFVGNLVFAMSNGDLMSRGWGTAIKTTFADVMNRGDAGTREYIQKLAKLRLIDSGIDFNDIKVMAAEMADLETDGKGTGVWDTLKKVPAAATKVYQSQDAVWKILAFENKKRQYARAFPTATAAAIEAIAAQDVRQNYPTYDKTPKVTRFISQFPLLGPFVSFPSEVVRTLKNNVRAIAAGMQSENEHLREMAKQRAVGLVSSFFLVPALSKISKSIFGVTPEEEEDLRKFQPPWSENSQFLYLGKNDDGQYDLIDLSFLDARGIIAKPLFALMREGLDPIERIDQAATELVTPLGEDLLFGRVMSIWRNQTPEGREVYNPSADAKTQAAQAGAYLGQVVMPGTVGQMLRIKKGLDGEISRGGKEYDALLETAALFGLRISNTDVKQAFGYRNFDFKRAVDHAEQGIRQTVTSRGTVKPGEIDAAYRMFNQQRKKYVADWHDSAMAAIRLGAPQELVTRQIAAVAGKKTARMILANKYTPYLPGEDTLKVIAQTPNGAERVQQLLNLYREAVSAENEGAE